MDLILQHINRYAYARNLPTTLIDPSGLLYSCVDVNYAQNVLQRYLNDNLSVPKDTLCWATQVFYGAVAETLDIFGFTLAPTGLKKWLSNTGGILEVPFSSLESVSDVQKCIEFGYEQVEKAIRGLENQGKLCCNGKPQIFDRELPGGCEINQPSPWKWDAQQDLFLTVGGKIDNVWVHGIINPQKTSYSVEIHFEFRDNYIFQSPQKVVPGVYACTPPPLPPILFIIPDLLGMKLQEVGCASSFWISSFGTKTKNYPCNR